MKIQFIGQASVIIKTDDCIILCDPWLFGTAFNDSWKLFPQPEWNNSLYEEITHLWISHEHPDHFHIPTLKSMPKDFKDRVVVLFQKNNSDKMPKAFASLGFKNLKLMPNRKIIELTNLTKVYNHQVGQMDSALAVISKDNIVLNLNDCEVNKADCKRFVKDLGKIDVVLNQFSMAGYGGKIDFENHLPENAKQILSNLIENHLDLGVSTTIPFASNIYFCCEDNKHINDFANTPQSAYQKFQENNLNMEVLYPNDIYDLDTKRSVTASALEKYQQLYKSRKDLTFDKSPVIDLSEINAAFLKRHNQLKEKYPNILLKRLAPIVVKIPDLNKNIRFSLHTGEFTELAKDSDFDLIINSQPLHFAFFNTWGVQTLGVSARWLIKSKESVWRWYRIITSINNAELYLKPRYFFSKNNINFLRERFSGGLNQLVYQLQRMKK